MYVNIFKILNKLVDNASLNQHCRLRKMGDTFALFDRKKYIGVPFFRKESSIYQVTCTFCKTFGITFFK